MDKYIIGRPINGIPLNGLEYALDNNQEFLQFDSIGDAEAFLKQSGATEEDIENFYMIVEANNE